MDFRNRVALQEENDTIRDDIIAKFKAGISSSKISKWLLEEKGITKSRNAVISILHRAGMTQADRTITIKKVRQQAHPNTGRNLSDQRRPPALPKPPKEDEPLPIGPEDDFPGSGKCKYTRDDVQKAGWRMCGHETGDPQESWCDWHKRHVIYGRAA